MIKAIFFDVDGTLISFNNPKMKKDTIETLKRLKEKGILIFIASGRHFLELQELHITDEIEFDGYVLLNGGYCFNKEKVIYECAIDKEDVINMCSVLNKYDLPALFIEKDDFYVNKVNQSVIDAQNSINTSIPKVKDHVNYEHIIQLDPYVTEEEIKEIMKVTKTCKCTKWYDLAYDIVPKNSGKKAGIVATLQAYQLNKDEVACFGDGDNDLEMFEAVGMSIAMGNASKHVKDCATLVCDDVDHEGITSGIKILGL